MPNFFVYGTLKKGFWNSHLLQSSEFLGRAVTDSRYHVIEMGFPGAVLAKDDEGLHLEGEVYSVTDPLVVARLDSLEGNGRFYTRHERTGTLGGKPCSFWIYELPSSVLEGRRERMAPVNPETGNFHWGYKEESLA